MINIVKYTEPPSLEQYRDELFESAENLPDKAYYGLSKEPRDDIKEQIPKEQGYICCYCMSRISKSNMRIEHWQERGIYPNKQLNYDNLLGACHGNERKPRKKLTPEDEEHCDVIRGHIEKEEDAQVKYNPANPLHNMKLLIKYKNDGTIYSSDINFDTQLNNVLNLNFKRLKRNRISLWNGIKKGWDKKFKGKSVNKKTVENLIKLWDSTDHEGKRKEYCGLVLYFLEKKLKQVK